MKTINLLFLGVCFIVISCDTTNDEIYAAQQKEAIKQTMMTNRHIAMVNLYEQIIKLDDTTEQLLVASALSPEEIHQLWIVKIENYRINNELSSEQSTFLTDLEYDISPQIFQKGEARNNFDFNGRLLEAQRLFGENEGWYFLNKVENIHHAIARVGHDTSLVDGGSENPIEACQCNKNSNCVRITGASLSSLSWQYGTCNSGGCYRPSFWFWESSNNGRCKY